ncbi:hypothetical protein [Nocardia testacea]|uniref:hypothetical protein n=1 Tax=Nocardia testacea TaxID=248551 RepID=UPI0033F3C74B
MFENWADDFSAPLRRVVDPPMPVLVELSAAIPSASAFSPRNEISMRAKSAGLDTTSTAPGLLYAWARCTNGSWLGFVHFAIPAGGRRGHVEARQWCPAHSLSKAPGNL